MAIDPVCGMTVDEQTAPATAVHNGTTYYFCAPGCKRTFEKDPEAVLKQERGQISNLSPVQMMPVRAKPASEQPPKPAAGPSQAKEDPLTPALSLQGRGATDLA